MSRLNAPARDSGQDAKQGATRRKTRAPKARTPEPKEIVSGAGQPLDPGVRRELEARLGHDLSRVRVHTDRDSAALTELIGADAVAVGPDLFFGEGKYRPAGEDGRRLLTHELLHTVQAPNPLGALRAGRDLGAVSLPQDAIEREAEHGAREDRPAAATPGATPGWLRYATVDADRFRTERLDPATLVDRLAAGILRSLRGDPTDSSGRVRLQLARFAPELQASVLSRLADRLPSSDYTRVLELVEAAEHRPADVDGAQTPEPVTDAADRATDEREQPEGQDRDEQDRKRQLDEEARQSDDPKGRRKRRKGHGGKEGKDDQERPEQQDEQQEGQAQPAAGEAAQTPPGAQPAPQPEAGQTQPAADAQPPAVEEAPATTPDAGPEQAATTEEGAQPAAVSVPGSPEAGPADAAAQPSAGTKPQEPAAAPLPQPAPVEPERLEAIARAEDSPLARHGMLEGDQQQREAPDEERPLGLEPGADAEVHDDPATDRERQSQSAVPGPELNPGDFLPSTDPDMSGVPTTDQIQVSADGAPPANAEAPEFPAPPATKADQVQAERESRPEDEAEPTAPEQAQPDPAQPAAAPEPSPGAEAEERSARDLQPEQPVEQEIGPDPATNPTATPAPAATEPAPTEPQQPEAPAEEAREAEPAATPEPQGPGPELTAAAPGTTGPVGGDGPGGPAATPDTRPDTGRDADADAAPGPAAEQADAPAGLTAQPAPDASLESGGGACAGPQQPTTEAEPDGGAGGNGGGAGGGCAAGGAAGGAPPKQEKQQAPPDVSAQDPQSALATAASLPPDQLATTLDGVDGSVDRTVGEQHARLQAAPPTVQRPSGAPQTQSGTPEAAPPAVAVTERLERVGPQGADGEQQKAQQKKVEGRNPGDRVAVPHVADDAGTQVSPQEVQQVQGAVDGVPTTDPALNTTVGRAPEVELTGESDPARTDQQAAKLKDSSTKILGVGREDAAKPMGEDRIYPDVPKETLTASVPGGGGKGGGARAGGAVDTKPGIGIVTQQERGPQIQAAVGQGQSQLGSEQAKQKQGEADARRQNQAEVDQAVADNAQAQAGERGEAAEKVKGEREQWRTEQDQKATTADQDADAEHQDKTGQIGKKRTEADKDVRDRQQQDNQKIQDKRKEAEEKAQKEKDRKKEESEGWWGWVKSKVKAAFDALVEAVTKVFDYFRGLINDIIDGFRKFANWAIDQARKFAVELIDKLADALIKICDVLLAAFPELRDKFRKKIEEWRDKAVAKVNEWADKLKNAVNKLLDLLAAGLNALLNALEAGLKAAIEAVRKSVMDAIDFVEKAIAVFGEFAVLIGDIASDPGGWLKKLGSAAIDGIQHYLWGAIKSAVKQWFNEKVESVVGLTSTIVNVLVKGCISMAQIGRMAWQAIVASLPGMIVSIVVEKLVSLIVPAAGAIMAIIQGLVAAWNTISKIVAAIGKFVTFLKAVKSGSAACLFADAVAAGVVALLDFISNFLLSKLKGAGKAVGTKLKGIAQKILKGLARAGKGARRAAGNAVNKARAGLRRATRSLRKPPSPGRARPARPARTGPARHTVRQAERHPSATPGRPRREVTRPKSTAPRRPTSPVGRALNASRQTVKAALNRVRVAARTLGRKLLDSKLGRALTNGAHRIRDAYRKQRDRLRAWHQKRQQQRAQRRAHENSPDAKKQRLELIVARIRPKVDRLLGFGIGRLTLRGVLRGMRAWYRLTGLSAREDGPLTAITAELNPEKDVRDHIPAAEDLVRKNEPALMRILEQLGEKLINAPEVVAQAGVLNEEQRAYQERRSASDTPSQETRPARAGLVEARAIHGGNRPPGHERIIMASGGGMEIGVSEQQGAIRSGDRAGETPPGLVKVLSGLGSGHYVKAGPASKDAAADKLAEIEDMLAHSLGKEGVSAADRSTQARQRMQRAFFDLVQRRLPQDEFFRSNPKAAETMAAAARLMPTVEGARYPAAAMTNIAAWQLANFPEATWQDVVSNTNTMAPRNAVAGSQYLLNPQGIAAEHTNSRTGELTKRGAQLETAVAGMTTRSKLLIIRAFAKAKADVLMLSDEQLVQQFPLWAMHNAARFLAPDGRIASDEKLHPGWRRSPGGLWIPS
ncbi:DUF4157 domain-containing protein [Kitasatospora sp. NPDC057542]|uniref:eCIS core domain-containing protein n=2 Tax=Streptomycetaceae TaxID=2062 RepID=UPI00369F4352